MSQRSLDAASRRIAGVMVLMAGWAGQAAALTPGQAPQGHPGRAGFCSPIQGTWFHSGKAIPISVRGDRLVINMSGFRRPQATGRFISDFEIEVSFPDDATYTGELDGQGTLIWSNGSAWQATSFAGRWRFEGQPGPFITQAGNRLRVNMESSGRPPAQGTITGPSKATVRFPDDATYSATLVSPSCLQWSNGTFWTK